VPGHGRLHPHTRVNCGGFARNMRCYAPYLQTTTPPRITTACLLWQNTVYLPVATVAYLTTSMHDIPVRWVYAFTRRFARAWTYSVTGWTCLMPACLPTLLQYSYCFLLLSILDLDDIALVLYTRPTILFYREEERNDSIPFKWYHSFSQTDCRKTCATQ